MAPKLRVSAGPSVDQLALVRVNDEDHPLKIDTPEFAGRVTVRIQGFNGVRPSAEGGEANGDGESASDLTTHYFDHSYAKGCTWSIQIQGRFKKEVSVDDVEYGNQFEKPIRDRLPWGTSVALRAIGIIDPNLHHDVYSDEPWAFGPLVTSMTRVNVQRLEKEDADLNDFPAFPAGRDEKDYVQDDTTPLLCDASPDAKPNTILSDFEDEGLADLGTLSQLRDPSSAHTQRARFWANQSTRQLAHFTPRDVLTTSFDNGFIDFNTLRAVLPYTGGMGFDLQHYWDGQPVRYFCRNAKTKQVYFVIE